MLDRLVRLSNRVGAQPCCSSSVSNNNKATKWQLGAQPFYSSSVKQQQSHQMAVGPSALLLVERQKTIKPTIGLILPYNSINTFFPESFFYSRFIFVPQSSSNTHQFN